MNAGIFNQSYGMAQTPRRVRSVLFVFTHIEYDTLSLAQMCSLQTPNIISRIVTIRLVKIDKYVPFL